jgi:hypothetical protein
MPLRTYRCTLPVSKNVVEFREVTFKDREECIRLIDELGRRRTSLQLGDILAAYAIVSINGQPPFEIDPTARFNDWHYKDASYYITFFSQLCLVTDEDLEEASREAKKLQMQYISGRPLEEDNPHPVKSTPRSTTSLKTEELK